MARGVLNQGEGGGEFLHALKVGQASRDADEAFGEPVLLLDEVNVRARRFGNALEDRLDLRQCAAVVLASVSHADHVVARRDEELAGRCGAATVEGTEPLLGVELRPSELPHLGLRVVDLGHRLADDLIAVNVNAVHLKERHVEGGNVVRCGLRTALDLIEGRTRRSHAVRHVAERLLSLLNVESQPVQHRGCHAGVAVVGEGLLELLVLGAGAGDLLADLLVG